MSKINWRCDDCKEPIAEEQGAFGINQILVRDATKEGLEEELRGFDRLTWTPTDWDKVRPEPRWELFHWTCRPEILVDDNWYIIDIERVQTQTHFIEWMRHLLRKTWFARTDIDNVMTRAQEEDTK